MVGILNFFKNRKESFETLSLVGIVLGTVVCGSFLISTLKGSSVAQGTLVLGMQSVQLIQPGKVTAKEAVELTLTKLKEQAGVAVVAVETSVSTEPSGRSSEWSVYVVSKSDQGGSQYIVKNGKVTLKASNLETSPAVPTIRSKWIDSNQAITTALNQGLPQTQNYVMYLGQSGVYKKYRKLVWGVFVPETMEESVEGVILDAATGEVLEIL